ncbi:MAG: YlxR family protein [Roseiflexus sp.]|nr:YlxR family protein [Roseiflexus sp.]MCS7289423.1 YlxR family protein [Roseiflexus sp.]MDW8144889.1 YlxR family protein [Roseiflexaceae bacterium]MDW8233916.1 YlxR family protein [Roseiflexaceae bacterium]
MTTVTQTTGKKRKGPRPKHVPQRTCVACRRTDAKRALIRLVRDAGGRVQIDPTGKRNGRGAYLCHDPTCWEQAIRRHALERALRISVLHPDDAAALEAYAHTLPPLEVAG